jgi:hypothetical protein
MLIIASQENGMSMQCLRHCWTLFRTWRNVSWQDQKMTWPRLLIWWVLFAYYPPATC